MMKHIVFTGVVVMVSLTGQAIADCTNNRVSGGNALRDLLQNNTICVSNGSGGWDAQEEHHPPVAGVRQLWDYKLGTGHAIDPRRQIGTWSASNGPGAAVTYNYTAFGPPNSVHTYQVYSTGGNSYDFCNGPTLVASGTLKAGINVGCP